MVGINKKPEMSDFEKGVVHGMSLAKAEAAVVEDWEAELEIFIHELNKYRNLDLSFNQKKEVRLDCIGFITTLLTAEREAGAREDRERIKKEITEQTLFNNDDDTFVKLSEALWVCDSKEDRDRFIQALTPPTK